MMYLGKSLGISFDCFLGWLKSIHPEIDGLTGKESNRLSVSDPNSPEVFVSNDAVFVDSDPGLSFQAIREQIFGSKDSTANAAQMNGFAQQAEKMIEGMSKTVMSGFKPEVLPVYTELANEFCVHSATSHGAMNTVRKDLIHGFPRRTTITQLIRSVRCEQSRCIVDENGEPQTLTMRRANEQSPGSPYNIVSEARLTLLSFS